MKGDEKMKKQKIMTLISMVVLLVVVVSASIHFFNLDFRSGVSGHPHAIDTYATNKSVSSLATSMNTFAFDLYKHISQANDGNIFFSPYSIFVALSMTYEGARNDTAMDMQTVLNFPQNNDTALCSFGKIYNLLNQDQEYRLNTANALWIQEKYPFYENYLHFLQHYYMAQATNVNYSNPTEVAEMINDWVDKNTHGKITDFLSSSDIDPFTVMILTNAIYFKGLWETPFDTEKTQEKDFEISPGETVKVPMMHSPSDISYRYTETETVQVVELPYQGDSLSMVIVLPKNNDISTLEQTLTYQDFIDWRGSFNTRDVVKVSFPRFTLETRYQLEDYLRDMGMSLPFTPAADFSGMADTDLVSLFIDRVIHQAVVDVTEEGTEAAAVTSVHIALTSVPDYVSFNANHPFLFYIQHKDTGTILFMGKLQNPVS